MSVYHKNKVFYYYEENIIIFEEGINEFFDLIIIIN